MGKIILTGDRPTGKLHIGHYVGSLKRRVELQNTGAFEKIGLAASVADLSVEAGAGPEAKAPQDAGLPAELKSGLMDAAAAFLREKSK